MTVTGSFEHFQCFKFETIILKNENLFQKTGVPFFESTKIENVTFPDKTVLSEANVKVSRTASTKSTYHKEQIEFFENLVSG